MRISAMIKRLSRSTIAGALLVGSATAAMAGDGYTDHGKAVTRYYFGVFGGLDLRDDQNLNGATSGGAVRDIVVNYDNGWVFGANVGLIGRDFSWGRVRGEVEFSYREADVGALALNGVGRVVKDGSKTSLTTGLVNAYYDTPLFHDRFRFSFGAGFGMASINHGINYLVANAAAIGTDPGNLQIALPSSETSFAWQLIGGAEVKINDTISFVSDVRYLSIKDVQVERYIGNTIINGTPTTIGTLDSILNTDLQTLTFTSGLRVSF